MLQRFFVAQFACRQTFWIVFRIVQFVATVSRRLETVLGGMVETEVSI